MAKMEKINYRFRETMSLRGPMNVTRVYVTDFCSAAPWEESKPWTVQFARQKTTFFNASWNCKFAGGRNRCDNDNVTVSYWSPVPTTLQFIYDSFANLSIKFVNLLNSLILNDILLLVSQWTFSSKRNNFERRTKVGAKFRLQRLTIRG